MIRGEGARSSPGPGPFVEIERVHSIFRLFEWESAQIGSGRPKCARSHLWGSIVVLSRAALEEALLRLHLVICENSSCISKGIPLYPKEFRKFFGKHGGKAASEISENLHVALQEKSEARSGQGTGKRVNGPQSGIEILELMYGLNHVRNGYAHQNPTSTESAPKSGRGLLWVKPKSGPDWTVQKPHAFSAMRFCETVYRFTVLSIWGDYEAVRSRGELPVMLWNDLLGGSAVDPSEVIQQLLSLNAEDDLRGILELVPTLRESVFKAHHLSGHPGEQLGFDLETKDFPVVGSLYDKFLDEPKDLPPKNAPELFDGIDA